MPGCAARLAPALAALALLASMPCAASAQPAPAAQEADDLQVALGRRIYLEGRNERGEQVRALVGSHGTALAGAAVACGNCHGADGRGRPEGGVQPPDITWEELSKPYGHVRAGGRRHGPYDERSFARAVTEGLDPAGQRVDTAMPRFSLSASEAAALAAYLRRLSTERDPGVSDAAVRLGTILPSDGPGAAAGAAMRAVLRALAAQVNEAGGIHGRRIELAVASDLAQAEERFEAQPVFALVSPYAVGVEEPLAQFAVSRRLAVVAPFTLATPAEAPAGVFFLYAGEADLARVLLDFAGRAADLTTQRLAAFVADADGRVARALRGECAQRKCAALEFLPPSAAADPGAAARLMHAGVQGVVFDGGERELGALIGAAARLGWRPAIYAPGPRAARAMYAAPAAFDGQLFVAYPARGELLSGSAGAADFERLRASRDLGSSHTAAQGFAYAALSIAIEGLRRAGRELSRDRFARALETLHRFDAGPTPPVSYGPGRRVGTMGGYVVAVDPQRGFRPVSDWIALEPR
ncbi:MAG TPA: ABC transporter substrate-binding protein [Burkholderiales bacterium]